MKGGNKKGEGNGIELSALIFTLCSLRHALCSILFGGPTFLRTILALTTFLK
jgi:hypothetical protein